MIIPTIPARLLPLAETAPAVTTPKRNAFHAVALLIEGSDALHALGELQLLIRKEVLAAQDIDSEAGAFDAYQLMVLQLLMGPYGDTEAGDRQIVLNHKQVKLLEDYIVHHMRQISPLLMEEAPLYFGYPATWLMKSLRLLMDVLHRRTVIYHWNRSFFLTWSALCKK